MQRWNRTRILHRSEIGEKYRKKRKNSSSSVHLHERRGPMSLTSFLVSFPGQGSINGVFGNIPEWRHRWRRIGPPREKQIALHWDVATLPIGLCPIATLNTSRVIKYSSMIISRCFIFIKVSLAKNMARLCHWIGRDGSPVLEHLSFPIYCLFIGCYVTSANWGSCPNIWIFLPFLE